MNRHRFIAAFAIAAVGAGAVATTGLLSGDDPTAAAALQAEPSVSWETVTVRRGTLASEREFTATLSHGDSWTINTAAAGTITSGHETGTVVGFGEPLVRVDNQPVTLARGTMPMYRELYKVNTRHRDQNGNRLKLQTGFDVTQLQTFVTAAGFDADGNLEIDGQFGGYTEKAVEAWQESVGLPVTGRVDNSQLVFEPEPVRINTNSRVGDTFTSVEVTGADPQVLVDTSTRDRGALPVDTEVEIDFGNDATTTGVVTDQQQVTSQDGSQVWRTTIAAEGNLPANTASATVTVTQVLADDVLLVPVTALLALSEGGFAIEIPTGTTTTLTRIEVGEVLDGTAEIDGDIAAGDEVLVPT
ncbi:MAG: peptidoglycan-binding protein [Actinomycetia bacterium]|nr:peptidoglycan-binding protein [Actinomycetes bacterium]